MLYKTVSKCSAWHSHRALYDLNILFVSMNICLFICFRSITLLGRNKAARNLHAICAKFQCMGNILSVKNPSCNDNRNLFFVFFLVFLFAVDDTLDFFIKRCICCLCQLLSGKSKMTSRLRSFYHNKIRCPVIFV